MPFVLTAPELVTAAAGNLAGIGSTLGEATASAAGPTAMVVAAAADEVRLRSPNCSVPMARNFKLSVPRRRRSTRLS